MMAHRIPTHAVHTRAEAPLLVQPARGRLHAENHLRPMVRLFILTGGAAMVAWGLLWRDTPVILLVGFALFMAGLALHKLT